MAGPAVEATTDGARLEMLDRLARQILRLMRQAPREEWRRGGPGAARAADALVVTLVDQGPLRTGELAEVTRTDPSTVSRQVAFLVRQGLVERRPDPRDGRACVLAPTAEGERLFQHYQRARDEQLAQMLDTWQEHDLLRLVEMLDRFNTDVEDYQPLLDEPVRARQRGEDR